jgi:hypothetical protein
MLMCDALEHFNERLESWWDKPNQTNGCLAAD